MVQQNVYFRKVRCLELLIFANCLLCVTMSVVAQGKQANDSEQQVHIAELIEQLGDSNYHLRNDAKWELERIGLAAFEQLRQASQGHANAHVARASRYLIESQNVVWWLESDSLEVRELLKSYNESKSDDRDTVLQQLSERGSPDALLALCRLARFESHELRSKSAALYLMQAVTKQLKQIEEPNRTQSAVELAGSIALTLEDSQRTSAHWLRTFIDDLENLSRLDSSQLARWQKLVKQEQELATAESPSAVQMANQPFEQFRSSAVTQRLYRWLGSWITDHYGREPALELVRSSLTLIGDQPQALLTAAAWAIDAELPELVPELAEKYREQFNSEPQLGYYLAESYLRLNNEASAQQAAAEASESVVKQLDQLKNLPNLNLEEIQANRHFQHARLLAQRGLFPWAEHEYERALSLKSRVQSEIRGDLAQFYWFGGEYEKAADALKPVAEEAMKSREVDLPVQANVYSNPAAIVASYHFYQGLAALGKDQKTEASDHLKKALAVEGAAPNPDVVIALKQLGDEPPFREYFQQAFEKMSGEFRIRVLEAEEQLSRASDRMSRAMAGPRLAEECNQLAWLLSKCEISPSEALSLSLRSLELLPDEPVYMDTLARCYFADGQIEDAIRTQKRAVQLSPHERQMLVQLREFEEALAAQKKSSPIP